MMDIEVFPQKICMNRVLKSWHIYYMNKFVVIATVFVHEITSN